jgi:hypothetical protein
MEKEEIKKRRNVLKNNHIKYLPFIMLNIL